MNIGTSHREGPSIVRAYGEREHVAEGAFRFPSAARPVGASWTAQWLTRALAERSGLSVDAIRASARCFLRLVGDVGQADGGARCSEDAVPDFEREQYPGSRRSAFLSNRAGSALVGCRARDERGALGRDPPGRTGRMFPVPRARAGLVTRGHSGSFRRRPGGRGRDRPSRDHPGGARRGGLPGDLGARWPGARPAGRRTTARLWCSSGFQLRGLMARPSRRMRVRCPWCEVPVVAISGSEVSHPAVTAVLRKPVDITEFAGDRAAVRAVRS